MICGIYKLSYDNLIYVGQSIDIEQRLLTHNRNLRFNRHHNYKMQEIYNTTKKFPVSSIIEECVKEALNSREVFWIDNLNSFFNGLNLTKGGDSSEYLNTGDHFNALFDEEVYIEILSQLANTDLINRVIADNLGVHKRVVDSISCMSNHKYLLTKFPELYLKMISRRKPVRQIKAPDGNVYDIKYGTGNAFAKLHGLDGNSLNSVMRGALKSTAGWTIP